MWIDGFIFRRFERFLTDKQAKSCIACENDDDVYKYKYAIKQITLLQIYLK